MAHNSKNLEENSMCVCTVLSARECGGYIMYIKNNCKEAKSNTP